MGSGDAHVRPELEPWLRALESERLRLVPAQVEHAELHADAAWESKDALAQWSKRISGDRTRAHDVQRALEHAASTARGTHVQRYAFTRELPERFVVGVAIRAWHDPRSAPQSGSTTGRVDQSPELELGYWCRTTMVGRGYAAEAVSAVAEHAFADLGATSIWLRMAERNARSRRLAERLAFTEVARISYPASEQWGDAATVLILCRRR